MHRALLVEEALRAADAEHAFVPDVRVDVEPLASIEAEADELLGPDAVAGKCKRYQERRLFEREKQLAAVRMVVGVPKQDARRVSRVCPVGGGRIAGIREYVVAADGFVAPEQDIALPLRNEDAFGRSALISGVFVDRPRTRAGQRTISILQDCGSSTSAP